MAAEYVVLKAMHPTYLNLQLPTEVAEIVEYDSRALSSLPMPARGIAFVARGPGVLRVLPTFRAGEFLPIETVNLRYLATAHLSEKLIFNLPEAAVNHLGLKVQFRSAREGKFTDDGLVWFLPAPEYYEYRARSRLGKRWTGPSGGGLAHVYLARSVIPWDGQLDQIERRIETEEWRLRGEPVERVARMRRGGAGG